MKQSPFAYNQSRSGICRPASATLFTIVIAYMLLFVCSTRGQTGDDFPVPPSFTVEGVPAIKNSDVGHLFFEPSEVKSNLIWDVDRKNRSLLVTDEKNHIYIVRSPMAKPETLIDKRPESVRVSPNGTVFAFIDDSENGDSYQLYVRLGSGEVKKLSSFTSKDESVESFAWSPKGDALFYSQIDYGAKASKLCRHDLTSSTCYPAELKGIWYVVDSDRNKVLLKYWRSSSNQSMYIYDVANRKLTAVAEKGNSTKGFFGQGRVFWLSEGLEECGGSACLMSMNPKTNAQTRIKLPNNLAGLKDVKISPDKKSFLIKDMRDGIDNLRVGKLKSNAIVETIPPFVQGSYVIWHTKWLSDKEVAYTTENISKPASIEVFDISSKRSKSWTKEKIPAQFENKVKPPEVINWKSFDGRQISGYMIKPQRGEGRSPVLIVVHGGPQIIDTPTFNLQELRFIANLGVTVIHTNIRGSEGFGLEFMDADNGAKRGDAVKDISSLIDWIEKQPELDPGRVIVRGESYGGFVALASAMQEPKRVKAVIAEYPLVSIRGMLGQTWTDEFLIAEYGDPKNEELMKQLDELSPLNNTDRWSGAPLFMTRGGRDERNPERDVLGLKYQLQERGNEVWFIYAKEAGHGVGGRYVTAAMYEFLRKQLKEKEKNK